MRGRARAQAVQFLRAPLEVAAGVPVALLACHSPGRVFFRLGGSAAAEEEAQEA